MMPVFLPHLPQSWRPPDAPLMTLIDSMPMIIMGVVGLVAGVYAWHWEDLGVVQANSEGIRFGSLLSQHVEWNEVATCFILTGVATSQYPERAVVVLEDAEGKRLYRFIPAYYPYEEAQRFVR